MKTNKLIGSLLIAGAIALFIPYNILIVTFDYPDILRLDTAVILTRFHAGGNELIWTWFAFAITGFKTIHQFAGVILGEHLGQLFTIAWTVMISIALQRLKVIPNWVSYFAYVASGIYLLAQAELFATVMPSFPVWGLAGFVGSTLWLIWLIILGIYYLRSNRSE